MRKKRAQTDVPLVPGTLQGLELFCKSELSPVPRRVSARRLSATGLVIFSIFRRIFADTARQWHILRLGLTPFPAPRKTSARVRGAGARAIYELQFAAVRRASPLILPGARDEVVTFYSRYCVHSVLLTEECRETSGG